MIAQPQFNVSIEMQNRIRRFRMESMRKEKLERANQIIDAKKNLGRAGIKTIDELLNILVCVRAAAQSFPILDSDLKIAVDDLEDLCLEIEARNAP